uniref:Uncharacterized protein n=1 Tax=Chenopodium quinoa TaxID=63459 RepID=A0A803MVR6_CHEQI
MQKEERERGLRGRGCRRRRKRGLRERRCKRKTVRGLRKRERLESENNANLNTESRNPRTPRSPEVSDDENHGDRSHINSESNVYLADSLMVFAPVLKDHHWWCIAFSLNRGEILVIDSISTSDVAGVHSASAIDEVFTLLDHKWETDINFERSWLLCEDLLFDFNEARSHVLELIAPV